MHLTHRGTLPQKGGGGEMGCEVPGWSEPKSETAS